MNSNNGAPPKGMLWSNSFAIALQFMLLELIKSHRAREWAGNELIGWLGALVIFAIYLIVLMGIGALVRSSLRRAFTVHAATDALAVYAASLLLWVLLSVHRETAPTADDALVLLLLSVSTAVIAISARRSSAAFVGAIVAVSGAAIVGGSGAVLAAHHFMLDPSRADKVALYAAGLWTLPWAVACAAILFRRNAMGMALIAGIAVIVAFIGNREPVVASEDEHPGVKRPNLIFIVVDTLRADVLAAYGGDLVTPAFSRVAQQGALFERAYAMAPWTAPSMVGMLSSVYPPGLAPDGSTTVWRDDLWRYKINDTSTTLAEKLAHEGYETLALLGNPILCCVGALDGFGQISFSHPITIEPKPFFSLVPFFHDAFQNFFPHLPTQTFNRTTEVLGRRAVHWLKQRDKTPFFMWVHFIDPHVPYDPPRRFRTREGPWPLFWPHPTRLLPDSAPTLAKGLELNDDEKGYVRSLYRGEVQYVDERIDAILATLREMELDDNTYVCIVADHGEELWDHDGFDHGQTLYEEMLHVPLLIRGPGIEPQTIAEPVSLLHLTPTLAEFMGLENDDAWKGQSLVQTLRSKKTAVSSEPIFAHATNDAARPEQLQCVIVGDDKLIRGALSNTRWLYNLADDPKETTNLAESESDVADRLEILLKDWLESFDTTFDPLEGDIDSDLKRQNDDALRALGYLE